MINTLHWHSILKKYDFPCNCGYQLQMAFCLGVEPHIHISISVLKSFLTCNCAGLFLCYSLWVHFESILLYVCIKYCIFVHIHKNLFLIFFCLFCLYHWDLRRGHCQIYYLDLSDLKFLTPCIRLVVYFCINYHT